MSLLGGFGPTIIAVMWTETILALIFVAMRLYTRITINHNAGWDDALITVTWFFLMPYSVACTFAALKGFGRHSAELTLEEFAAATKAEIIGQTFCIIGIAFSKASVALFLLRITTVRWHRWALHFLVLSVTVICVCCALFDFIRCDPVAHVWDPDVPANCWISTGGFTALSITTGAASSVADFVLAVLPWFILWDLQIKPKEKALIAAAMSLGLIAMVCGIVRTVTLKQLTARSDYSFQTVGLILWSSTELMVSILTATIPTLRPLYKQIRGMYSDSNNKYPRQTNGYRLDNMPDGKSDPGFGPSNMYTRTEVVGGQQKNDDNSDKSILGRSDGPIIRTDAVTVEYEDAWSNKSKTNVPEWQRNKASEQETV